MYSADPISPNSSAPQLPNIMDLRGLHLPGTKKNREKNISAPCSVQKKTKNKNSLIQSESLWATTFLTLFDHPAQHPGQFQHDRCPTARVDGTMNPTVPVVPIDHIPVCGHKHTQNKKKNSHWLSYKLKTHLFWLWVWVSPGSTLPLIIPITLEEFLFSS